MAGDIHVPLEFPPGIQRDGTKIDSKNCVDGLWNRFRLGRPRKMGGFHKVTQSLTGKGRKIHCFYQGSQTIAHIGTQNSLQQLVMDDNGDFVSMANRTPAAFGGGLNPGWTLDALFDQTTDAVQLIAHSTPDLTVRAGTTASSPFIGLIDGVAPLVPFPPPLALEGGLYSPPAFSGGIVCVQPYVFGFGSDGFIGWSPPNDPAGLGITGGTSGAGAARISAQKIIAGAPIRGGAANSPAALFWSLSELISATFVGSPAFFAFNTVSPSSSILSGASIVEYDTLYFWAGVDRFLVYNGSVVEVPNKQNQDWFFDNMNWEHAGKSFAFKVPRFGEIWFCAPLYGNTEPSHAAILNVRENCWYDTQLPNGGRGAGHTAQGFRFPFMTGVQPTTGNSYKLWRHESGTPDETADDEAPVAVRAYFETPFMGGPVKQAPDNSGFSFGQLEPDFARTGDMTAYVIGGANPLAAESASEVVTIKGAPTLPAEQMPGFKFTRRLGRLHIESNTLGGNYIAGRPIMHGKNPEQQDVLGALGTPMTGTP